MRTLQETSNAARLQSDERLFGKEDTLRQIRDKSTIREAPSTELVTRRAWRDLTTMLFLLVVVSLVLAVIWWLVSGPGFLSASVTAR